MKCKTPALVLILSGFPCGISFGQHQATDTEGFCTPALMADAGKLSANASQAANRMYDLASKISAAQKNEKTELQVQMDNEVKVLSEICATFHSTWGDFSCNQRTRDGLVVPQSSTPLKASCAQLETFRGKTDLQR